MILENNHFDISNYLNKELDLNAYSEFLFNITSQKSNHIRHFVSSLLNFQKYLFFKSTQKHELSNLIFNYSSQLIFDKYSLFSNSHELMKYLMISPLKNETKNVMQEIIELLKDPLNDSNNSYSIYLPKNQTQNQQDLELFALTLYFHVLSCDGLGRFVIFLYSSHVDIVK